MFTELVFHKCQKGNCVRETSSWNQPLDINNAKRFLTKVCLRFFKLLLLCGKKFSWHQIFAVLWLRSELSRTKVFQWNSQVSQFFRCFQTICKSRLVPKKLKQWSFGNLGINIWALASSTFLQFPLHPSRRINWCSRKKTFDFL